MLVLPAAVAWAPRAMVPILSPRDAPVRAPSNESATALPVPSIDTQPFRQPPVAWWPAIVASVYTAGVLVLLCGAARAWWKSRALIRQARHVRGRLTHARCVAPVTVGVLQPVGDPAAGLDHVGRARPVAVLAHEGSMRGAATRSWPCSP